MRRFALMLVSLVMVLSAAGLAAQEPPAVGGTPLEVIDSRPFTGEELGVEADIVLYFNRPVNCETAAAAFSIVPTEEGTVSCNDANSSLRFTPTAPLQRATAYTVTVNETIRGQDGAALAEAFTLDVNSLGFLMLSDALPAADSTGIDTDAVITAIFNRPVVPLLTAEEAANLPSPLSITPEVSGRGEWLNTSIYVFRPDPGFAGGTQYTVSIRPELQAQDGATMQETVSWSFATVLPEVVEVTPTDLSTNAALDQTVQVRFNQAMDQASAEANFCLRPRFAN